MSCELEELLKVATTSQIFGSNNRVRWRKRKLSALPLSVLGLFIVGVVLICI